MLTILLIGGYGTFGQRIVTRLASEADLHIIIAGRNIAKANTLCETFNSENITLSPLAFDRENPISPQVKQQPDIIIDASGPFQNYTNETVAEYCIANEITYFDLSDDRDFCAKIMAKTSRAPLVTGLSTYPVLTAAAAKVSAVHFDKITKIEAGISPAPATDMGRSVVGAIAAKAGEPIVVMQDGNLATVAAMTQIKSLRLAVPGATIIGEILFSRADTPETDALPRLFPNLTDIWCGAGPRPRWLHQMFIWMAKLRALKLLPNLGRFTGLMHRVQNALPARDNRGGMCVYIHGTDHNNAPLTRDWHLIAQGENGPYIPALPAVLLIQKILRGETLPAGPHYGRDLLTLSDFQQSFAELGISHGFRGPVASDASLYHAVLGPAYDELPYAIQQLHDIGEGKTFQGKAAITRGRNVITNITANIFGFPKAGEDIPVTVNLTRKGGVEHWTRHFGGRRMFSTQEAGTGRDEDHIIERFGPVAVKLEVIVEASRLYLVPKAMTFFGVPLPKFLLPHGETYEKQHAGIFHFHVDIIAPIIGRLVKYEGHLEQLKTPPQNV